MPISAAKLIIAEQFFDTKNVFLCHRSDGHVGIRVQGQVHRGAAEVFLPSANLESPGISCIYVVNMLNQSRSVVLPPLIRVKPMIHKPLEQ